MADSPSTRLATRLSFLVAGFGIACWAPMVPLAKLRLGVDEGVLGALLLCLGAGSVMAMLVTGALSSRFGTRPVILVGGFGLCAMLPLLAVLPSVFTLGAALMVLALLYASPRLLRTRTVEDGPHFALPHGIVLVLAGLTAITLC